MVVTSCFRVSAEPLPSATELVQGHYQVLLSECRVDCRVLPSECRVTTESCRVGAGLTTESYRVSAGLTAESYRVVQSQCRLDY
jgi:hypothetical protein